MPACRSGAAEKRVISWACFEGRPHGVGDWRWGENKWESSMSLEPWVVETWRTGSLSTDFGEAWGEYVNARWPVGCF